ncbi:MAG: anthranilate synthase component I [Sphaerochaeta sp.]|uniref:anthranilate synthase component I n=1 Tax=Sphaerochaeta sp. TaxID=1972642 RepID=UPI002635CE7F|nr:anthranilate synthase component I [Sphaerochaeta sp.]MCK9601615.1 anthranilate synthase component I [Sphaerochaeta sp.]MDX9825116.1 anthranilate synthase component I [Sphaerochaeta sp.]HPE93740.1 anthranilate synthase component I [Sphaerochaeta sp.]
MNNPITYDEALALKAEQEGTIYVLSSELLSDHHTPITVLNRLKQTSTHCFLLESVDDRQRWGRYSFLGYHPKLEITCKQALVTITDKQGNVQQKTAHPADVVRQVLSEYKSVKQEHMPPFTGGLVGYFSYDYFKYQEPSLKLSYQSSEAFKDMDMMLFDQIICFDHYRQKILLLVHVAFEDGRQGYEQGLKALQEMRSILENDTVQEEEAGALTEDLHSLFDEQQYCAMVEQAKHYIHEGDVFQVVLSNRWEAGFSGSLLNTYRILRTTNPSPYMFYISGSDLEIAGASPETLVNLQDGIVHTFPLAGTRSRGRTEEEDKALEASLLADEKECAEHNMLVDLGRNDLGKISVFGSVKVEEYLTIQRYSHVMHIGSTVRGTLAEGKDALDAVAAVLPAGTLSGAPKLRACEIIEELEQNQRGIYGGAIGYLGFNGNMDTCIAIRFAYRKNGKVYIQSGAGIVADSVSQNEWHECEHKSRAMAEALRRSTGGCL